MTLTDLVQRLSVGVMREDLAPLYPSFINEALTEIQRRRSWIVMKANALFTVQPGENQVSLVTDDESNATRFKELTLERSPVHLQSTGLDGVFTPCEVWSREKVLRRQARLISNSLLYSVYSHPETARRVSVPVWIEWTQELPSLNILFPAQNPLPFSVSYYGYLPDLDENNPSNSFTNHYPEMVLAKAKAIAFAAINDPVGGDFEALFEKKFSEAAAQDAYQAVAGMELRM